MAGLNFAFTGNPAGLIAAAQQSQRALEELKGVAEQSGSSVDEVFSRVKSFAGAVTGIGVGVEGLRQFATQLVSIRSEFQDTEAKLKVFLKSEEAAKEMMNELEDLAWNNTFEFTDITKAAAQLLAYKTPVDEVGDTINRLSEIAAGTGVALGDMVQRFNKVKATNVLDSQMQQAFASMGVDIKSVVAELDGLNRSDLDGVKLNFNDLQRVIAHLTDEGGMFFGMMKERGKNISDSIAGVRDNFAIMMNEIGESVQAPIKAGIDKANEYIENWKEVAKAIGGAIVALGTYKAAFAAFEGVKAGKQKLNFELEKQELEAITKATNEQKKVELELLEQQIAQGTAARDADIELAVAKGTLTEAQALEIVRLRELAAEQVSQLTQKAQIAAKEKEEAVKQLQSIDEQIAQQQRLIKESDAFIDSYDNMSAGVQQMIQNLGEEAVETKVAVAQSDKAAASKKLQELQTQRLAAAERVETTSKTAEATAANADAAAQAMDTVGKKVNEKQTTLLTKAQLKLKAVMEATGLSMLANPYVLAAAAIASVFYGIYKLITAESAAERATRKHNEALEEQKNLLSQIQDTNKKQVGVIQDKTATDLQKTTAFNELKAGNTVYTDDDGKAYDDETQQIMNSAGQKLAEFYGTADKLAAASRDEVQKMLNQYSDEAQWELAKKKVDDYQAEVEKAQANIDAQNAAMQYGGQGATWYDYQKLKKANEELEVANQVLADIQKNIDETNWNNLTLDEKKLDFETNLKPQLEGLKTDLDEEQKKLKELGNPHWWQFKLKAEKKQAEQNIEDIKAKIESIEDKEVQITIVENDQTEDTTNNVAATVKAIREQEKEVKRLQKIYAKNGSETNQQNLEKAQSMLGVYTKRYQTQTGKSWVDSTKTYEEIVKAEQKAANERVKIENKRIQDERVARKADLDQQIKEIEQQSKEWSKSHNGRVNKAFASQIENLKIQFEIDTEKADRQFAEWKRNFERSNEKLRIEIELGDDERAIKYSTNAVERVEAMLKLRERELKILEEENKLEKEKALINKAGGRENYQNYLDYLQAYITSDGNMDEWLAKLAKEMKPDLSDDELYDYIDALRQTFDEMSEMESQYNENAALQKKKKNQEYADADLDMLMSIAENYADYNQKIIEIDRQHQEALVKANKLLKDGMIDKATYDKFVVAAEKQYKDGVAQLLKDSWNIDVVATDINGKAKKIAISLAGDGMDEVRKISVVKARKLLEQLKKAFEFRKKGKEVENNSIIANLLGIDEQQASELTENTDVMLEKIDLLENAIGSFSEKAGNDWSGLLETFMRTFKSIYDSMDDNEGMRGLKALGQTFKELFNKENRWNTIGVIAASISQLYDSIKKLNDIDGTGGFLDSGDLLGAFFQNIGAAGQGAATGSWIGAIVGGVTDGLNQIVELIAANKTALVKAKIAAENYSNTLREISYKEALSKNVDGIFGDNVREKLNNAIKVLNEARANLIDSIDSYGSAALAQIEQLGGLDYMADIAESKLKNSIWGIATGGVSALFSAGSLSKISDFNKELARCYELSVLIGGVESYTTKNVKQFTEALSKGYNALEAMQVKTLDKKGSRHDEWMSLKDLAPQIWNEDGSINTTYLDAFIQAYGDNLTEGQRLLLEQLKADQSAYNESLEQALSYYGDIFGNIGQSIEDSFVSAFTSGENALDSFTDSIGDMLEEWIKSLAYMAYIAPVIEKAQADVENAVKNGKTADEIDEILMGSIETIFANLDSMQNSYTSFLEQAKNAADTRFGTDLFNDEDSINADKGGFQSMSQDTADELNARFTALQIEGANVVTATNTMLDTLALMQANSDRQVMLLQSIETYQLTAYQQAEERLDIIRAIRDNTDTIVINTNRLQAIEQNTDRL